MRWVIRCTNLHFSSQKGSIVSHFKHIFLNWWWRYRVGCRNTKIGQINIHYYLYKCANFRFLCFFHKACHRADQFSEFYHQLKKYTGNEIVTDICLTKYDQTSTNFNKIPEFIPPLFV